MEGMLVCVAFERPQVHSDYSETKIFGRYCKASAIMMIEIGKSLTLTLLRGLYPLTSDRGRFTESVVGEILIIHTRDFDVNVNPI